MSQAGHVDNAIVGRRTAEALSLYAGLVEDSSGNLLNMDMGIG